MRRTTARAAGLTCAVVCAALACSLSYAPHASGFAGRSTAGSASTSAGDAGLNVRPTSGPAPLTIPAGAGATVTSSLTLENTTPDTRFEIRLTVGDPDGPAPGQGGDAAVGTAASWLTTGAAVITLEPGTTRDVPITAVVPRGAPVGPTRTQVTVTIERATVVTSGLVGVGEGASETLPVDVEVTGESVGDLVILGVAARQDDDAATLAVRVWNRGSAPVSGYGAVSYGSRQDAFRIPEVGPRSELEQRVPWSPGDERRQVAVYVTFGEGRVAQWSGTIDPGVTDEPIAGSPDGNDAQPSDGRDGASGGTVVSTRRSGEGVPLYLRALVGAAVVIPGWFLGAELLRRRRKRPSVEELANAPPDTLDTPDTPDVFDTDTDPIRRAPRRVRPVASGADPSMHLQLDRIAMALEQLATVMVPGEATPTPVAAPGPSVAPAPVPTTLVTETPVTETPVPATRPAPPMPAPERIATPDPVATSESIRAEVDALISRITVTPAPEPPEAPAAQVPPAKPAPAAAPAPPAKPAPPVTPALRVKPTAPAQTAPPDEPATPAELLAAVLAAPAHPDADEALVARVRSEVRSLMDDLHPPAAPEAAAAPDTTGPAGPAGAAGTAEDRTCGEAADASSARRGDGTESTMLASIRAQIRAMVDEVEATVRPGTETPGTETLEAETAREN